MNPRESFLKTYDALRSTLVGAFALGAAVLGYEGVTQPNPTELAAGALMVGLGALALRVNKPVNQ